MSLINSMNIKVIIVIAIVISVFKLVCTSVIVVLSIVVDVVRFISPAILVAIPWKHNCKQTDQWQQL